MPLLRRTRAHITAAYSCGAIGLLTIAVVLLAAASAAPAATPASTPAPVKPTLTLAQLKLLWATVNICDTENHADTIGVAASMPLLKHANRLYMRFRLQYWDESDRLFKPVPGLAADSDWELAGRVGPDARVRRAGHDFTIAAPSKGAYVVRALVTFEWRRGKKVLLSARRVTTAGHPKTAAADPKRYSAAACSIE
jgi:hypothetical protein